MQIEGVPNSIEWPKVAAFLGDLGIDWQTVKADGIRIGAKSIECVVYAKDASGHFYLDMATEEAAVHVISIPITHPERDEPAA